MVEASLKTSEVSHEDKKLRNVRQVQEESRNELPPTHFNGPADQQEVPRSTDDLTLVEAVKWRTSSRRWFRSENNRNGNGDQAMAKEGKKDDSNRNEARMKAI